MYIFSNKKTVMATPSEIVQLPDNFPEFGSNLVSALTSLNVHDFSHFAWNCTLIYALLIICQNTECILLNVKSHHFGCWKKKERRFSKRGKKGDKVFLKFAGGLPNPLLQLYYSGGKKKEGGFLKMHNIYPCMHEIPLFSQII